MLSEEQEELKRLKILRVAKHFMEHGGSMIEVGEATGVPASSVQRYLNDQEIIILLGREAYDSIQDKLKENKQEGLSRGGKNYYANNEFTKDELGKFSGSKKR